MRTSIKVIGHLVASGILIRVTLAWITIAKQYPRPATAKTALVFMWAIIVLVYCLGMGNAPNDKFTQFRKKVLHMRKHADKLRENPYTMQLELQKLNTEIVRARNTEKITELEMKYLIDSLNQVLVIPVRF